tara:strand:+ start:364 stop:585 length:222 start_codon:yes stop_codon:yes gene_type:complete
MIEEFKSKPVDEIIIPAGICYTTPSPRPVASEEMCHNLAYEFAKGLISLGNENFQLASYKCFKWDVGYLGSST